MAGRTASAVVTKYPGIQVQTSSLGINIPIGAGTFRCGCNLVYYTDFKAIAQKAASGKGGQTTTGYSYTASLILAICEGPIDAVTQVWINGKTYANGSNGSGQVNTATTSACAQVGLALSLGAIGQAVWPYLLSNHPADAIGYSGLAHVHAENYALDGSASPPNHSFEVVIVSPFAVGGGYTGPDIDPSLWLRAFFEDTRRGVPGWPTGLLDAVSLTTAADSYRNYCLAVGLLLSPVIDQQRSASDCLTEYLMATNSNVVWSEGLLKFIAYGDTAATGNGVTFTPNLTPIYSLGDNDFIVEKDGDPPLLVTIQNQSDAYNTVQFEFLDRTNQYNMAIALQTDAANVEQYGERRKDPDTVHCICTASVAAVSAQLWLQRTLYVRAQYRFKLSWAFALLEPGDIVELTDAGLGLNAYPVRIIQIDEDEKYGFSLVAEDLLVGVNHAPLYVMQPNLAVQPNHSIDPGGVEANLLLQSTGFPSPWGSNLLTITAGATTNPVDASNNAAKFLPTTSTGLHYATQAVTIFADANYTFSIYLKQDGYHFVQLQISDFIANGVAVNFDLSLGVQSGAAGTFGSGCLVVSTSITDAGGGWFRCSITAQLPYTAANVVVLVLDNTGAGSYAGDGVSAVFAYGPQLTQGVDVRPYTSTALAVSGPAIFNPPMAMTPGGIETWAAVAGGANWAGANVWVSYDTTNYQLVGTISQGPARLGDLTANYPSHADPDTTNTLSVDLSASNGVLESAAQATTDAAGTLCLIDQELIGFETASLVGPNRYSLISYNRRGMLNTTIASHLAGAPFIRLDASIFTFPYNAAQAGVSALVKFQSFNQWGLGVTPLANCRAYAAIPVPLSARLPSSSAWTAVGTSLTNAGQSIPAIVITGMSDNASATSVEFFIRQTGTSQWESTGWNVIYTTQKVITSVAGGQTYDVGVAYLVNQIPTPIQLIASAITAGNLVTPGAGGIAPGQVITNTSVPGSGQTITGGAGTYTHADIVLTGYAGAGSGAGSKSGFTDTGGGGANVVVVKGFPFTPGTVLTLNQSTGAGVDSALTGTGLSLVAHPGVDATTIHGAGGPNTGTQTATGATSVTSYAGRAGGAVDTWDGGGPGAIINISSGTVTAPGPDNTTDNTTGSIPGQGGAGTVVNGPQAGGGPNLLIIART